MGRTPLTLFATRRFLPLFVTLFLGALNDNLFRQALIILITYKLAAEIATDPAVLTNLAIGLFILPFFLFSALAGQLADKFEKAHQIVWIKVWEVGLMIVGAFAFYFSSLPLLIGVLSGLGLQSTFFGPIKYGVLPDLMKSEELLPANAVVEAGTFIAILIGVLVGGLMVGTAGDGGLGISILMIALAVIGVMSGRLVPKTGQAAPTLEIDINIFRSTWRQLRRAWQSDIARPAIVGISWIWLYGSIYIAQIPVIVKERLAGDNTVVTLIIACFTVGIGAGSLLCNRILKAHISARLAKPSLYGLGAVSIVFTLALPTAPAVPFADEGLLGLQAFLLDPINWIIVLALLGVAVMAGMVIVPLYAILQDYMPRDERSRTIAANNIVNSGFMAGGTIAAAALIFAGLTTVHVFLLYALCNILIAAPMARLNSRLTATDKAAHKDN